MRAGQVLLIVIAVIGLSCASSIAVIAISKFRRGRADVRSRALLAPYRHALIAIASGEDEDGQAKTALSALPAPTWDRLRPSVVAFLPKVRGTPADDLGELLRSHGEIERATRMLTSRSAIRRTRAAYLLGLVRDPNSAALVLPLLGDPDADVRLVAARALGAIGEPSAASGVLHALRTYHGQIGLPAWVAAEALLAMGVQIAPALRIGLASEDPAVRNVCALVAGHGTFASAAPQLRILLATDSEGDVRASAAVALGRVGGAEDEAALARHTDASETTALRRTCATALGDLGQRESLDTLAGLLDDGDRRLAQLAADALVRIGSEGITRLKEAAAGQCPSARVARGALDLAGLRGQLPVSAEES
ncbi:HEAT repeat domain-containing protein [Cryobacterium tagatosivorans]|uniref:HEAT repeat domain-containing protein n=1 Tax=Cryobacterium tagatosivorans TaxID=1259199 RepID=A0A4R8UFB7_9MICO|nr:HEAT repeat domain-containing protein [Cryobacterium tagatosivorans]TFB50266.1 HEAT repeat domain-containing protein [Cryobacterium tagatosivorans]